MKPDEQDLHLSPAAGILRLFWMMLGNAVLLVLCLSIARQDPWNFSWRDVAYAVTLTALLAVRWIDITRLDGQTADGEPATISDWWRWSARVVAFAVGGWVLAKSVGL